MLRRPLRYVALGDSFTIGTSVPRAERWPDQLVTRLAAGALDGPRLEVVGNLAVNGWTSGDVIAGELPRLWPLMPEFVSLLIGVNDVVRAIPLATYRRNVAAILDALLDRLPVDRLLTVSTPDYTVTPRGAEYGEPGVQATAILAVNAALAEAASERHVSHVDIHDLSLRAANDPTLIAPDGLHPGGPQYALWIDRIAPAVMDLLAA